MQTLKDAQGAAFSVYEPTNPPARPEAAPELGDTSWHELRASGRWWNRELVGDFLGPVRLREGR